MIGSFAARYLGNRGASADAATRIAIGNTKKYNKKLTLEVTIQLVPKTLFTIERDCRRHSGFCFCTATCLFETCPFRGNLYVHKYTLCMTIFENT